MKRQGTAEWSGGLKEGKGSVSTESKALDKLAYSFQTRFEQGTGTNPEELIAAAHAGCFSMAFAAALEKEGFTPKNIQTTATVSLEKNEAGFSIPSIHLAMKAKIPHIDHAVFNNIATQAKEGCPVSKVLRATITLDAVLEP